MINVIIVDDEPLAQDVLETFIEKIPEFNLVQKCSNAFEANEALKQHDIQLMFLDIQMPQLTGTDFLRSLAHPPVVIFTTAYSNYAVDGFELNALDYLLKPISMERFLKASNKAIEQIGLQQDRLAGNKPEEEGPDFIFVKADKKLIKINFNDVIYIEGLKDYVIIRLKETRVVTLQTMKSLEDKLPSDTFRRIHRSYIVNWDNVDTLQKSKLRIAGIWLPIGETYAEVGR